MNQGQLDKFNKLLGNDKKKTKSKASKDYRVPYKRKYSTDYRIQEVKKCIEQLQPRATFHRILICCAHMYKGGEDCNMDLFSDLHDMLEKGILSKSYEKEKQAIYFIK